jgi:hypothetical protein
MLVDIKLERQGTNNVPWFHLSSCGKVLFRIESIKEPVGSRQLINQIGHIFGSGDKIFTVALRPARMLGLATGSPVALTLPWLPAIQDVGLRESLPDENCLGRR